MTGCDGDRGRRSGGGGGGGWNVAVIRKLSSSSSVVNFFSPTPDRTTKTTFNTDDGPFLVPIRPRLLNQTVNRPGRAR